MKTSNLKFNAIHRTTIVYQKCKKHLKLNESALDQRASGSKVIFNMECRECIKNGKENLYTGESSNSGIDRVAEHLRAIQADDLTSLL